MRSCVVHCATRLLLAFALVLTARAGVVRAVTPDGQDNPPRPRERPVATTRAGKPDPDDVPVIRRPGRPDARKRPDARTQTGKVPGNAHGGTQAGDQKGRTVAPVVVPPVLKPPKEQSGEPPPKLPRFAALKTDDTNMRRGPGQRYPIDWVYKRRDLPVEVEREYDVWRLVRDPEGTQGWVHQVTLSDRRTFMVKDKDATLRADPSETSGAVAVLKVGVIGRLRECDQGSKWCQVQVGGYRGYLLRDQFWGLLPDEVVAPS